jgi:hypothetical protein
LQLDAVHSRCICCAITFGKEDILWASSSMQKVAIFPLRVEKNKKFVNTSNRKSRRTNGCILHRV